MSTPRRPLPAVDDTTASFWRAGADSVLRVLRCGGCGRFVHPPVPICPSPRLAATEVSGRAPSSAAR